MANNQEEKNQPDSIFGQILALYPENVPYTRQQRILAAYEIGLFKPNHQNMLAIGDSIGGQVGFTHQIRYTLRYYDVENTNDQTRNLAVKTWNNQTGQWDIIESALFEDDKNIVSFDLNAIPGLIIISEEIATAVSQSYINQPNEFQLMQNYPNPFNSGTKIEFYLSEPGMVDLSIYNILGEKVTTILNKDMSSGLNTIRIELNELSSGIYYYMLNTENQQAVRKMILIK